jgi:hypothetical protein
MLALQCSVSIYQISLNGLHVCLHVIVNGVERNVPFAMALYNV